MESYTLDTSNSFEFAMHRCYGHN